MPLTETGFKRRTFDEIVTAKAERSKELFGEDIETGELSVLGKYNRINAYDQALTEELAEMIYNSISPNSAIGTSLDRLCVFAGIRRNAETKAQYIVTLTGEVGAVISKGFLVGTESGINYGTIEDVTIGENGSIDATVECELSGEIGNVLAQEINKIANPSADVSGVVGKSLLAKGEETESDYELRQRFNEAIEGAGSCNEVAIKAALLRVPTVTHAGIIVDENNGSFECFINGGHNHHKEIAETIFEKKPIGIKTTGNIAQEIIDSGNNKHTINFSHTTNATVYVRTAIKTNTKFEGETGKQEIKNNLETYIDNVGIGNPVILSSLYGQIHSVVGVQEVVELQLSTDGVSWSADNITVDAYENCMCVQVEIKQNDGSYEVIS